MSWPSAKRIAYLIAFLPLHCALATDSAYEDRLIQQDALWSDPEAEDITYDSSGLPRSARIELVKTIMDRNGESVQEDGILFGFRSETENYGALSVEGSIREGGNGVLTAWQRNLQFNGGWRANNGAGMLNTTNIDLARRQYRFFIPTAFMQGATTEWTNGPGTQFSAGVGQPGLYTGIRVPAFMRLPGTVFSLGGQTAPAPNWEFGVQMVGANGATLNSNSYFNNPELSTTGALTSAAWTTSEARVQANLIGVHSNLFGTHSGGWVDGWFRGELVDHSAGVFRLEPGLIWANQQIVTDMQGAYYRANYQTRQWLWDGGVDYAEPVSKSYKGTLFFTGSGRYQMSRDWGFGAGGNVRQGLTDAWSTFAYTDNQNGWGSTRAQINHAHDTNRQGTQLTVDQNWRLQQSFRLSTAISLLREAGDFASFNNVGLSVFGGGDLGNNVTLDGNVQWNSQAGLAQGPSTYVNLALNWRFLPGWVVSAFAYQNNAKIWRPLIVDSPIINPDLKTQENWNDRGVFLSLRYEFSAGRASAPLGGAPGDGGGRITGVIYFDQNDDGRMNSGEQGIANLTVILNGKFATRTDASGRFEFAQVSAGQHVVTVQPDNLPLPWRLRNNGRQEFTVNVRDTTTIEIGAFIRQ